MPDIRGVPPVGATVAGPTVDSVTPDSRTAKRRDIANPDLPPSVHRPRRQPGSTRTTAAPRSLFEAVNDATFTARDPREIAVPAELLAAIGDAETVLLIGHTNPDTDASGSTLALARLLEAMGKRVDLCIDDDLPGSSRILDHEQRIKRAAALTDKRWDLALVVDVSQKQRIGGAAALLGNAATVAVVDHHVTDPQREEFDLPGATRFLRWLEPDFPAAGLQAMAIIARYLPTARRRHVDLAGVCTPALAAFVSDTGFGRYPNLDPEYFRFFKHVLTKTAKVELAAVEAAMKFELPEQVDALIDGRVRPGEAQLPRRVKEKLVALERDGKDLQTQTHKDQAGREPAVSFLSVTDAYLDALAELGKTGLDSPPLFIRDDLVNALKWGPAGRLRKTSPLVVMLLEGEGGRVTTSIRGRDDRARRLAEALGGGGHDNAAGAVVTGTTLAEVRTRVLDWVREFAPGGLGS